MCGNYVRSNFLSWYNMVFVSNYFFGPICICQKDDKFIFRIKYLGIWAQSIRVKYLSSCWYIVITELSYFNKKWKIFSMKFSLVLRKLIFLRELSINSSDCTFYQRMACKMSPVAQENRVNLKVIVISKQQLYLIIIVNP